MSLERTADIVPFPDDAFADVLASNEAYSATRVGSDLTGWAARGLAVVTCMDSRIDPLGVLGMQPGDAKILRNAGARVTEDVLRTLVLATYLLGVDRVLVMPHTDCRMAKGEEVDVHAAIFEQNGVDTRSIEFRTVADQRAALITDVTRIRAYPLLPDGLVVGGAILDIGTGRLEPVEA
jgi:carbonic anhydrase